MATAACESKITYIDGDNGVLLYRGYPIEQIATRSNFLETAYLLIQGELPVGGQLEQFDKSIRYHTMINETLLRFFNGFHYDAHPMAMVSAVVSSMAAFYHDSMDIHNPRHREIFAHRILAKIPTISAAAYKHMLGQPFVYPRNDLDYCANMLHMFFAVPAEEYVVDPMAAQALDLLLILHADHEQNASTSTVRLAGSTGANPYAAISAGCLGAVGPGAWRRERSRARDARGDRHGRQHPEVPRPRQRTRTTTYGSWASATASTRISIRARRSSARCATRCWRGWDRRTTRCSSSRCASRRSRSRTNTSSRRKLYPNVDFYSGVIYSALGIPRSMFTVMFAIARTAGWVAHWQEMIADPAMKIGRPRQLYTGPTQRDYLESISAGRGRAARRASTAHVHTR